MKRVINGVAYNTDTATMIARLDYDDTDRGSTRGKDTLYQTKGGAFFLHEHQVMTYQGRNREWAEREQDQFTPMTREAAEAWAMNGAELLSDVFGDVPEATAADTAGASAVINIRLPASLKGRVESAAKAQGLSMNSYAMRCFEQCLGSVAA